MKGIRTSEWCTDFQCFCQWVIPTGRSSPKNKEFLSCSVYQSQLVIRVNQCIKEMHSIYDASANELFQQGILKLRFPFLLKESVRQSKALISSAFGKEVFLLGEIFPIIKDSLFCSRGQSIRKRYVFPKKYTSYQGRIQKAGALTSIFTYFWKQYCSFS